MAGRGEQQRGGVLGVDRGERNGEKERATAEEAQGHSPLQRQRNKMREREKPWRQNGFHVSIRTVKRDGRLNE